MASPAVAETSISTRLLLRIVIAFIAAWSLLEGIVLVGFHGASSGALGVGVTDTAGQRLVGAHLLVLAPSYVLIAWGLPRYESFVCLPIGGQLAVAVSVAYAMIAGETQFADGILACALSTFFAGLLSYVWIAEQRMIARARMTAESDIEVDSTLEG